MNNAFNAIKSTISAGWKSKGMAQFKNGLRTGGGGISGLSGIKSMDGLKNYGKGMAGRWNNASNYGKAGMATAGGAGAIGAGAAADFLNPWGLGWGD